MADAFQTKLEELLSAIAHAAPDFALGAVFFLLSLAAGHLLRRIMLNRAVKQPERGVVFGFIGNALMAVFMVTGAALFIRELGGGKVLTGLLAGAGFISIIIGIAFKDIAENFLAGILLAFSRPFSVGDLIETEGTVGRVMMLNLRNTHLRTGEGRDVFVPNSMLINRVLINYTRDGLIRHNFILGIDNDENIGKAMQTAMATLQENRMIEQKGELKPFLLIERFGESTIDLKIYFWTNSKAIETSSAQVKSRVMQSLYEAFKGANISMPGNITEWKKYMPPGGPR